MSGNFGRVLVDPELLAAILLPEGATLHRIIETRQFSATARGVCLMKLELLVEHPDLAPVTPGMEVPVVDVWVEPDPNGIAHRPFFDTKEQKT